MATKEKDKIKVEGETMNGNPFVSAAEQQVQIPQAPNQELINAINVLIAAINIAQSKGAYNIEEAGEIWDNIQTIHSILHA